MGKLDIEQAINYVVVTLSREQLREMNGAHPKGKNVQFFIREEDDGNLKISF